MPVVYLNGEFLPADEAKISVFDRGFLFGDGVYEVIPVYDRQSFRLASHLSRLQNSLDGIRMQNPFSEEEWTALIEQIIAKNEMNDQAVYLQVTRGVAPRDHLFPENVPPTVFMMSNPLKPVAVDFKEQGISAITVEDIRWQYCDIKAISLLPNTMMRQQAHEQGAQEAIMLRDGLMTEGSASNSYAIFDNVIYTAIKDKRVLPGITREVVFDLAVQAGIAIKEQELALERLYQADEIWISSSTRELLPVTRLDGKLVGTGQPGPVWKKLDNAYQQLKRKTNNE
ncbi:hypothetical protein LCGC14_0602510 [marine sediment metagenome]|uniref:D-alanine aminotransferase n=1 Tax=marine sediment metagenome TaxID=412755 RepID=A0A0F9RU61_9ZZZZ|nr:D-amino-acid transaminase [Methylophaga aminisulfidivorans]